MILALKREDPNSDIYTIERKKINYERYDLYLSIDEVKTGWSE